MRMHGMFFSAPAIEDVGKWGQGLRIRASLDLKAIRKISDEKHNENDEENDNVLLALSSPPLLHKRQPFGNWA
jgi:hypothetical protein